MSTPQSRLEKKLARLGLTKNPETAKAFADALKGSGTAQKPKSKPTDGGS